MTYTRYYCAFHGERAKQKYARQENPPLIVWQHVPPGLVSCESVQKDDEPLQVGGPWGCNESAVILSLCQSEFNPLFYSASIDVNGDEAVTKRSLEYLLANHKPELATLLAEHPTEAADLVGKTIIDLLLQAEICDLSYEWPINEGKVLVLSEIIHRTMEALKD